MKNEKADTKQTSEVGQVVTDVDRMNDAGRRFILTRMIDSTSLSHVLGLLVDVCNTEAKWWRFEKKPNQAVLWDIVGVQLASIKESASSTPHQRCEAVDNLDHPAWDVVADGILSNLKKEAGE